MHVSSLGKGQPYGEMGESYVIFLADGNVFGDGRAIHEIRLTDEGNGIEEYRSAIYVADIAGYGKMETVWDKFCHDMHTAEIGRIVLSWMREGLKVWKKDLREGWKKAWRKALKRAGPILPGTCSARADTSMLR